MIGLIKARKWPALSLSIRQIRYLVYVFAGCFFVLVLLSWSVLLKYRVHEALDRQEILFRSQTEQLQGNLHAAEGFALRVQGALVRVMELGVEKQLARVNTSEWVSRLQQRGDRPYIALPVSAGHEAIPAGERLSALAGMLSFSFRVNNFQSRNVQNAYLMDVHADRLYVIPRRLTPARDILSKEEAYQRFMDDTKARLRGKALMEQLYAAPEKAVMLEPAHDWVSGIEVVTLATLVQVNGEPVAVLALDFPVSTLFPAGQGLSDRFMVLTRAGTQLLPQRQSDRPLDQKLLKLLAQRSENATGARSSFIREGLLPQSAVFEYQLDAWGWRTLDVVEIGALWQRFRENTLWLLGLTGLSCVLMLGWVWLVDRRIMQPTQMQSQRLQESEALGRTVIQAAGVGLMIIARETCGVLLANDAARQLVERALPGEPERIYQECCQVLASGAIASGQSEPQSLALKMAQANGQACHLEVRLVETTYQGTAALLCALNDVSAAKQSEAKLREAINAADAANRAKSSFLATMSHEIRTPLNGMLGSIELLGLTHLDPRQRDQLAVTQHAAQSLIQIINDVLDFSKIEAEQMSVQPRACQLDELVEETVRRFAPDAARKKLRLLCMVDPALSEPVLLDPLKVEQVLSNLVSNAVKFTGQGKVVVAVSQVAQAGRMSLQIRVIDTGIGIASEDQDRLFSPFLQVEQSDTRRYGGTGLGLSICQRLVGLMGGEVRLVSEPGLGSCFIVRLPLNRPESVPERMPAPLLNRLVVGLCVTQGELHHAVEQLLQYHGARAVTFDPESPPVTPVDVLVCDEDAWARCGDADVVIESMAPVEPDPLETPIRVSQYAWRGLLRAISVAAGLEQPLDSLEPLAGAADGRQATHRLHVLLVEDHPVNQMVMRQQLEWLGQKVDLASHGQEALALAGARQYDLILTDLQMPGMDGYTLARRLRDQGLTVPIVAITASVGNDVRGPCEAAGISRCLTKPALLSTLREMLDSIPPPASNHHFMHRQGETQVDRSVADMLRDDLFELANAQEEGDANRFRQRLHALSGALATLGHGGESRACRWFEAAVKKSGFQAITHEWQALRTLLLSVIAHYEEPAFQTVGCGAATH